MNKILWTDFHANMHSKHLDDLDAWYGFAREMLDFWAPVYYPYCVNEKNGFHFEDTWAKEKYSKDWEKIRTFVKNKEDDFILYLSYEWQGDGTDGDHNVFYCHHDQDMKMPLCYKELCDSLKDTNAIAIPHHTGYKAGHRGKNWATHNAEISPVVEIYSSHGCSESSNSNIPLNVHIHMGPRGEEGTFLYALKQGVKIGVMASGDNHVCPAISGNGFMGVISDIYTREGLFEAIKNRHTYGVTRSKIELDFRVNNAIMGSEIVTNGEDKVEIEVNGTSAIDRIEVFRNAIKEKVFTHSGKWEDEKLKGKVKFKFELELGWGPDRRIFPDIYEKIWDMTLKTQGKILNYEKCFTSPGSEIIKDADGEFIARIKTIKAGQGGEKLSQKNYLTPHIQNQSIIFEIEDDYENELLLKIDKLEYNIPVKKILEQAILEAKEEEVEQLLKDKFDFETYYREDPWWHNAYKILLHKASPEKAYNVKYSFDLGELKTEEDNIFIKIVQQNGDVAWSSPIWIKRRG